MLDISDLYKADITIPIAFEIASTYKEDDDIGRITRHRVRDKFMETKLLEKIVKDLQFLFEIKAEDEIYAEVLNLWDDKNDLVKSGVSYKERE